MVELLDEFAHPFGLHLVLQDDILRLIEPRYLGRLLGCFELRLALDLVQSGNIGILGFLENIGLIVEHVLG